MIDGHATLDELRNASTGTVFRERRPLNIGGLKLGGVSTRSEYRGATAAELQARLDRLEAQSRELDRRLGLPR